jgi:hypothetical protein
MKAIRNIISLFLVIAMLSTALPLFSPEDAGRDGRVDLEDAILHARGLARAAEEPGSFSASMQKAVSTLQLLAGLKTVIKQDNTSKSSANSFNLNLNYLISAYSLPLQSNNCDKILDQNVSYKDFIVTPSPPPPCYLS